ncbi:hypothetical protein evm_002628 [Chilo suppressalis]|nr:hypothetical protein evm_002628 [Chilo suppressalis]
MLCMNKFCERHQFSICILWPQTVTNIFVILILILGLIKHLSCLDGGANCVALTLATIRFKAKDKCHYVGEQVQSLPGHELTDFPWFCSRSKECWGDLDFCGGFFVSDGSVSAVNA